MDDSKAEDVDQLVKEEENSFAIIVEMLAIMRMTIQTQCDNLVGTVGSLIM